MALVEFFHLKMKNMEYIFFKKGFDADVIELIGNFEYIDRKRTYTVYEDLRRIKHLVRK